MTWTTAEDGTISIDGETPMLSGLALADLHTEIRLWGGEIAEASKRYGYPYRRALATAHAEGVIPVARQRRIAPEDAWQIVAGDGGHGIFQITSEGLKRDAAGRKLTNEEVREIPMNVDIGVRFLTKLRGMFGDDLPITAAAYNSGAPRPSMSNRWRLVSSPSYIERTVAANNTIIALGLDDGPTSGGLSTGDKLKRIGCSLLAALGLGYVVARMVQR